MSGHRKLFHDQMKARITLVATAAVDRGSMMRARMERSPRPSMRAASRSERGTASKAALNTKMHTMVEHTGRASPKCVLRSRSSLVMR